LFGGNSHLKALAFVSIMNSVERDLRAHADSERAAKSARYFKSGKGEYGEGDLFLGLTVPHVRAIAKKYWQLPYGDVAKLLASRVHEERFCALEILVFKFTKDPEERARVYTFYCEHLGGVNNWDLVDTSAPYIVGAWLFDKQRKQLYTWARSKNLWERRIAIVSTQTFIRRDQYADTLAIAELLLTDEEDLLHKATGWMLREVGNRNKTALVRFLQANAHHMPRTMLRYAIEKLPEKERKAWLSASKEAAKVGGRIAVRDVPRPSRVKVSATRRAER
jgi:3-methyladenine DNA glycosylase AlkD